MKTCTIDGCDRPHKARGWCHKHYMHWHTYGVAEAPQPTIGERLAARSAPATTLHNGTACIEWRGTRTPGGYGQMSVDNRHQYVHRLAWELTHGPIPSGLQIDHLCRNRACLNPDHLEPVTGEENTRRAAAAVEACPQGHPYDEVNTYVHPTKGYRQCRTCDRERKAA